MAREVLEVIWQKDRIVSFTLDEHGDIHRVDFPICPHCHGLIDADLDAKEHIEDCGGED